MKKYIVGVLMALLFLPQVVSAQTVDNSALLAQIQQLMQMVISLQAQLEEQQVATVVEVAEKDSPIDKEIKKQKENLRSYKTKKNAEIKSIERSAVLKKSEKEAKIAEVEEEYADKIRSTEERIAYLEAKKEGNGEKWHKDNVMRKIQEVQLLETKIGHMNESGFGPDKVLPLFESYPDIKKAFNEKFPKGTGYNKWSVINFLQEYSAELRVTYYQTVE